MHTISTCLCASLASKCKLKSYEILKRAVHSWKKLDDSHSWFGGVGFKCIDLISFTKTSLTLKGVTKEFLKKKLFNYVKVVERNVTTPITFAQF